MIQSASSSTSLAHHTSYTLHVTPALLDAYRRRVLPGVVFMRTSEVPRGNEAWSQGKMDRLLGGDDFELRHDPLDTRTFGLPILEVNCNTLKVKLVEGNHRHHLFSQTLKCEWFPLIVKVVDFGPHEVLDRTRVPQAYAITTMWKRKDYWRDHIEGVLKDVFHFSLL